MLLFGWGDLDRAHLFAQSDDLREAIARNEVADEPDLWLLEEPDQVSRRTAV